MLRRSGFKPKAPPRRDRSEEFASWTPRPARAPKAGSGVVALTFALPPIELPKPIATNAAGARHMGKVAALGCVLCRRLGFGFVAAEVHHLRCWAGGAERASDFLTIGLCPPHHRGDEGIHGLGPRAFERRYDVDEPALLADVICLLTP
jgi:hypothetical protein